MQITQATVQCLCGKLSGCSILWIKSLPGGDINHAKLHRNENISVIAFFTGQIGEIIIGGMRLLNCHIKCLDKFLYPCSARYYIITLRCIFFPVRLRIRWNCHIVQLLTVRTSCRTNCSSISSRSNTNWKGRH